MVTMEVEVINVFFEIDEVLKGRFHKSHHHADSTDSEVITVGIMKALWHMKTDQAIWRLIRDQFKSFLSCFPMNQLKPCI